jgi:trk system potassium uptake protein TrkA
MKCSSLLPASIFRAVKSEYQRLEKPYKRIMIVGGGNIGFGLAQRLEKQYSVKLIERDQQRAAELAENLQNTIVFYGDASDQDCWPRSTLIKPIFSLHHQR